MRNHAQMLTSVAVLLTAGVPLRAQSMQTGALLGTVRNKAGKPLGDAKLTARSVQTERVATSNAKGEFRLPLLNVGDWSITVTCPGYQTSTAKAHVGINDSRTVNFKLVPIETVVVEVVSSLGTLDTTNTQVSTSMDADKLALLPTDMTSINAVDSIMATVPGVQTAFSGSFNVMGGTDAQNLFTVDGNVLNQTFWNTGSTGTSVNTQPAREFLESVEVVTSAFGAEYGAFGGVVNSLTKSGTNSWSGSLFYATNFPHSRAKGFYNPELIPKGNPPSDPDKFHRYGATVSGPIVKDKLYFFIGYQGFKDVIPPTTYTTGNALNWDGLRSEDSKRTGPNQWSAKVNWFLNNENQLILSAVHSKASSSDGNQYYTYGTANIGARSNDTSQSVNLTWNWMPKPNFFLVASIGNFKNPSSYGPIAGAASTTITSDYRYFLTGPGSRLPANRIPADPQYISYATGNGNTFNSYQDNPNAQIRLDATWILGNHQIKAGLLRQETRFEISNSEVNSYSISNDQYATYWFFDPGELDRYNMGASSTKYTGVLRSYYFKDVWEVVPGVRVDAGMRFDPFVYKGAFAQYDGKVLESFDHFGRQLQPRIGVVWDVNKDGRKKLFAHFGRFFMAMPMSAVSWAANSASSMDVWYADSWVYNNNYSANQTPFTLLKQAPDFSYSKTYEGKPRPVANDPRLAHKDTWTLGGDWSLGNQWTVGALWTYWDLKDALDDSYFLNADGSPAIPGLTGKVLWNPRPGKVTFRDSDGVEHTWNSNFPSPKDRYSSLNLHARQNGERHYVSLDYTWVHHYGNYQGEGGNNINFQQTGSTAFDGAGGQTNDFDYAKALSSGNYEANPVHEFKARGAYRFNAGGQEFEFGSTLVWQSGIGLTRTGYAGAFLADDPSTFGGDSTQRIAIGGQRGNMGHTPSTLVVGLDLAGTIRWKKVSYKPNVSITNLFNSRTLTGYYVNQYSGYTPDSVSPDLNYGKAYRNLAGRAITAGLAIQF